MSSYVYRSRSIQSCEDEDELEQLADELVDALKHSPVLKGVQVTVIYPNQGESAFAIDIMGMVEADYTNQFSGVAAFSTADEEWLGALEACGLARSCIRSRMDAHQ